MYHLNCGGKTHLLLLQAFPIALSLFAVPPPRDCPLPPVAIEYSLRGLIVTKWPECHHPGEDMSDHTPKTDLIRRHLEFLRFYPESVEGHYNLGLAYLQAGELEDALRSFERALELRPTLTEALINMGGIYFRQGRIDECIRANERALEIAPDLIQARGNLAFAFLRMQEWDKAIEACSELLKLDPTVAMAHYHMAIALHRKGQNEKALDALQEASRLGLDIDPSFAQELRSLGKKKRGVGRAKRPKTS